MTIDEDAVMRKINLIEVIEETSPLVSSQPVFTAFCNAALLKNHACAL